MNRDQFKSRIKQFDEKSIEVDCEVSLDKLIEINRKTQECISKNQTLISLSLSRQSIREI
jgi:hypothetical protein